MARALLSSKIAMEMYSVRAPACNPFTKEGWPSHACTHDTQGPGVLAWMLAAHTCWLARSCSSGASNTSPVCRRPSACTPLAPRAPSRCTRCRLPVVGSPRKSICAAPWGFRVLGFHLERISTRAQPAPCCASLFRLPVVGSPRKSICTESSALCKRTRPLCALTLHRLVCCERLACHEVCAELPNLTTRACTQYVPGRCTRCTLHVVG